MAITHTEATLTGAQGMQLYYQTWMPEGPVKGMIALVHGFGEHGGRYNYLVDVLIAGGYGVCADDHRGHGRSPGQRGHIDHWDDFMQDVRALLETTRSQAPDARLFLYGHSLGGLIVLSYAIRNSQGLRGVIASAPALSRPGVSPALIYASRIISKVKPDFGLDTGLDASTISRDPAEVARYTKDPLVHSKATARLSTEMETATTWTQAHAGDLKVPMLLYHGGGDKLVPIEGSRTFYANVKIEDKTWIEWPEAYHECHNDTCRADVFAAVLDWLNQHAQL